MTLLGNVRTSLFGIRSEEAVFRQPGFASSAWQRFQPVAHSLVEGYHASLEDSHLEVLVPRLDAVESELRGFAYEGAGMGIAALDILTPWQNRLRAFVDGPGAAHIYPVYVGVGMALARLHRHPEKFLSRLDPLLCWGILDGYGFHAGFFSWKRFVKERESPMHLSSYAQRIFDQGLGRSIWFSSGANVESIIATLATFPQSRQNDLWSGVGAACAFAGGVDRTAIEALRTAAGPYSSRLAQGAAIAAQGRQLAGTPTSHTELACEVFCGCSSTKAAHLADLAREDLPFKGVEEPTYEIWRQRIQELLCAKQHLC